MKIPRCLCLYHLSMKERLYFVFQGLHAIKSTDIPSTVISSMVVVQWYVLYTYYDRKGDTTIAKVTPQFRASL